LLHVLRDIPGLCNGEIIAEKKPTCFDESKLKINHLWLLRYPPSKEKISIYLQGRQGGMVLVTFVTGSENKMPKLF